jgi:glycerate dehydrogenase
LGIVGFGELGQAVANLARAFGMNVLISKRIGDENVPSTDRITLDELLPQVDILTLHCALNAQTHHLINDATLAKIKKGALLINTARGALVDPHALLRALTAGQLGGAAIDVLGVEPPTSNHPLLNAFKQGGSNLILTPHCAWASREARQRLVNQAAQVVTAFVGSGKVINEVII